MTGVQTCALPICYDPDVKTGEDFHFYLRLSREWLIEFTRELVVSVRQHDGPRLFGASDERIRTEQRVLQEFADVMAPALRARYLKKIGGKHVRMGNGREGRRVLCQAIALSPLDGEAWGQLAVSFLGKKTYTRAHDWVLAAKRRRFLTST